MTVVGLLLLTACAPLVQRAGRPEAGFAGPRLEAHDFVSFDGARLATQHWEPPGRPWAVIVGLHGMNDYSNTFRLAAGWWATRGIATWAYDQRGFGRSPGRGIWAGRGLMDQDLRTFTALIRQRYPGAIVAVVGVSMGGAVAIDSFASSEPPQADRLVLASPAVWGWSSQPLTYRLALWLTAHTFRGLVVNPPSFIVENITASDNFHELVRMGEDKNLIWGARPDALYGLVNLMQQSWAETGQVKAPTLYLYGAKDQIIPQKPAFEAAGRLPAGDRTAFYANGYHLLLIDLEDPLVWKDVEAFLRDPAAPLPSRRAADPAAVAGSQGRPYAAMNMLTAAASSRRAWGRSSGLVMLNRVRK
jgi:alpha-beta hydrolase superfamily lysophospholipase